MARILLKNGKIFDGERFSHGSVLIEDGKIAAIGQIDPEIDDKCVVIDAADCTVCPGLVDVHTHLLELSGLPFGFPGALATVPFGVTAAVDASAATRNSKNADALPIETAALLSLPLSDGEIDFVALDRGFAAYGARALGVKIYYDEAQGAVASLSQISEVSAYAHGRGGIVMVHCAGSPTEMKTVVEALSAGDILTHVYHGGAHTVEDEDYAAYRLAKEKGVIIDAGMAGSVHTDFGVLARALEKGFIPDVISTDITQFSAYMRGGIYGLPMCMSICRALGMAEEDILRAVTSSAARAVKRADRWGRLPLGEKADLAVLSFGKLRIDTADRAQNRLVLSEGYTCRLTVKDGQILYRNEI